MKQIINSWRRINVHTLFGIYKELISFITLMSSGCNLVPNHCPAEIGDFHWSLIRYLEEDEEEKQD